jgi:hypothetical protein
MHGVTTATFDKLALVQFSHETFSTISIQREMRYVLLANLLHPGILCRRILKIPDLLEQGNESIIVHNGRHEIISTDAINAREVTAVGEELLYLIQEMCDLEMQMTCGGDSMTPHTISRVHCGFNGVRKTS